MEIRSHGLVRHPGRPWWVDRGVNEYDYGVKQLPTFGFFRERYGFAGIFIIFCAKTEDGKKTLN